MDHMEDDFARVKMSRHETKEHGPGRDERRTYLVCDAPDDLPGRGRWRGLKRIGVAISDTVRGGESCADVRYDILSRKLSARSFGGAVRGRWGIEIPQSEGPRGVNLCASGRPGYHRRGRPARAGRVVRPAARPRSQLMFSEESYRVPPRARPPRRSD